MLDKYKHFTIINNNENLGPSVRLNQGCKAASGKYLFLMDSDDILAKNALVIMLKSLKKENADFIFGINKVVNSSQEELYGISLQNNNYQVNNSPMDNVLNNKYG